MTNFKKYSIFLVLLIVGILGLTKESKAASIWQQQLINSATSTNANVSGQIINQGVISGTINSVSIFLDNTYGSNSGVIADNLIKVCEGGQYNGAASCPTQEYFTTNNSVITLDVGEAKIITWTFDATTTSPTNSYTINFNLNGWTGIGIRGSTSEDAYTNGSATNNVIGGGLEDIYFRIGEDIPDEGDFIDITYPLDGTNTTDFLSFSVQYSISTATTTQPYACVKYATTSTSVATIGALGGYIDCTIIQNHSTISGTGETFQIGKTNSTAIGNWFAKAYIIGTNTFYVFASSTIINYGQNTADAGIFLNGEDITEGYFGTATSTTQLENLKNTMNLFKTVFPFSVFFGFQTATENAIIDAEENLGDPEEITLQLGFLGDYTFSFDIAYIVGDTVKQNFFDIQAYIIYLLMGYHMYKKVHQ